MHEAGNMVNAHELGGAMGDRGEYQRSSEPLDGSLLLSYAKLNDAFKGVRRGHKRRVLNEMLSLLNVSLRTYRRRVRTSEAVLTAKRDILDIAVLFSRADFRARADEIFPADFRKLWRAWVQEEPQPFELPTGDAKKGEIQVVQWSRNLINPEDHGYVADVAAVYVDAVEFYQRNRATGHCRRAPGYYLRIESPKSRSGAYGAVVLPVCRTTGDVLLLAQYRHPQRRFLVEAPRGFPMLSDRDARQTAERELEEETGILPAGSTLIELRSLYTDTGKLADRPVYFLALIDRLAAAKSLPYMISALEAPCWIPLAEFYRAVTTDDPVHLSDDLIDWSFIHDHRAWLSGASCLDQRALTLDDAFTVTAALLARRRLRERFPNCEPLAVA